MDQLVHWYEAASDLHPIKRAAELHTRFVKIHPFVDGNGRTARLLLNFELMKAGFPPAVIQKEDRLAYYDALDVACLTDNFNSITLLVAEAVKRSLAAYLSLIPPQALS